MGQSRRHGQSAYGLTCESRPPCPSTSRAALTADSLRADAHPPQAGVLLVWPRPHACWSSPRCSAVPEGPLPGVPRAKTTGPFFGPWETLAATEETRATSHGLGAAVLQCWKGLHGLGAVLSCAGRSCFRRPGCIPEWSLGVSRGTAVSLGLLAPACLSPNDSEV